MGFSRHNHATHIWFSNRTQNRSIHEISWTQVHVDTQIHENKMNISSALHNTNKGSIHFWTGQQWEDDLNFP